MLATSSALILKLLDNTGNKHVHLSVMAHIYVAIYIKTVQPFSRRGQNVLKLKNNSYYEHYADRLCLQMYFVVCSPQKYVQLVNDST